MKTVVLCRHAKSAWPDYAMDIDRPLKQRGVEDAHFLGKLLGGQSFDPDLIISSPARRAQETAEIIARETNYEKKIRIERSVYYEETGALVNLIHELPVDCSKVMIFGHNPTMETAVRFLLQMDGPFEMPTSGMACLESMTGSWTYFQPKNIHLRWMLVPRLRRKNS